MEIGIDRFAASFTAGKHSIVNNKDASANLLERIEFADKVGLDVGRIGEHHRKDMLYAAPIEE